MPDSDQSIPWDLAPRYCEHCGENELISDEEIAANICDDCLDEIAEEFDEEFGEGEANA